MATMSLNERAAIVTGAASGIGEAVTRQLRVLGVRVAGIDLAHSPSATMSCRADLRDADALAAAVKEAASAHGDATILVHCAGICPAGSLLETDEATYLDTYNVNAVSIIRLLRLCVPGMQRQGGGSVVLTSSINARYATPTLAAYAASKAAVESLVRTASLELAPSQIRVNAIAPASVDTPMLQASFDRDSDPASARERNVERHPLGRLGAADDVAALATFLVGDDSAWITGTVIPVDGGAAVTRR